MVADEGCMTIVFRSSRNQAGHVFDPHSGGFRLVLQVERG